MYAVGYGRSARSREMAVVLMAGGGPGGESSAGAVGDDAPVAGPVHAIGTQVRSALGFVIDRTRHLPPED